MHSHDKTVHETDDTTVVRETEVDTTEAEKIKADGLDEKNAQQG